MEAILYRAKRKDNGEWVEGYYAKVMDNYIGRPIHIIISPDSVLYSDGDLSGYDEIIPETLGRLLSYACYDGYQECERLFQNDIIGVWPRRADVDNTPPENIALVTDEHSITVAGLGRYFPQDTTRICILGNAYDNPELLHGHDMRQFISSLKDCPGTPDEYIEQHHNLTEKYGIHGAQAGCYLCNFENDYICHQYNGGCPRIDVCRKIRADEQQDADNQ